MNRSHNPFTQLVTAIAVAGLLCATVPLPSRAVDVQPLPIETAAVHGYNYKATITFQDLTNAAAGITTITLLPRSGSFGTNTLIGPVGYCIDTPFTNSTANYTNLQLYIGVGGTAATGLATNTFVNGIDIDARQASLNQAGNAGFSPVFATNHVAQATSGTNTLVAVFKATNNLSTCAQGQISIYFRAVDLGRLRNQ